MKLTQLSLCFLFFLLIAGNAADMKTIVPSPLPPHPRIMAANGDWEKIKIQIQSDPVSARVFQSLKLKGNQLLTLPPVERTMIGRRLLATSRTALERISILAMLANVTGDDRYARRAREEMLATARFSDWNPSHFLDVAEMSLALALGYDWLYDRLPSEEKDEIARALLEKGIKRSFADPELSWVQGRNNWNQVCHAGISAAAIAIADRDPALAEKVLQRAVKNIPMAAKSYAPDGAYFEGPMYWGYGTLFHVVLASMMERLTGSTQGLADFPGFAASADYISQVTNPSGKFFNYSDSRSSRGLQIPLFWFSQHFNRPDWTTTDVREINGDLDKYDEKPSEGYRLLSLILLWRLPTENSATAKPASPPPPLHWYGKGENPIVVFRSAYDKPEALYAAIKGGSPSLSHAHMDAGSFTLSADGVQWAIDPGMQEYESLEKLQIPLWAGKQDGGRWNVFRLGPEAHNIARFNGAKQQVVGNGKVEKVRLEGAEPFAVLDLSSIYKDQVPQVKRGLKLIENRAVLIQDEWEAGDKECEYSWQFMTFAKVQIEAGKIILTQEGKTLTLEILDASKAKIDLQKADDLLQSYDAPNPGLLRLTVKMKTAAKARGSLRVLAVPGAEGKQKAPAVQSLEDWK